MMVLSSGVSVRWMSRTFKQTLAGLGSAALTWVSTDRPNRSAATANGVMLFMAVLHIGGILAARVTVKAPTGLCLYNVCQPEWFMAQRANSRRKPRETTA